MSPTLIFALAAALVVALVLALLVPPLWRRGEKRGADRRSDNVDVYRDQLDELERDRDQGTLAAADFAQAQAELQRRLLDEVKPAEPPRPTAPIPGSRKSALALLVIVPLAALAGYTWLGTPQGLAPVATQAAAHASDQQMDAMLAKLVQRLKDNPDDAKGWLILARSYKALSRFAEAADAFGHAGAIVETDAALLAEHADVLAASVGGNFDGKPDALLARALKLDPKDPQTLFVAGAVANQRQDYARALRYWEPLLAQLQPGSEEAESIKGAVDEARQMSKGGARPVVADARPAKSEAAPKNAAAASNGTISGEVTISGKVAARANPDDLLFVFARSPEGSRMPIAVIRTQVSELPLKFRLDDTLSLPGGQKLSEFKAVNIEARVAKAGKAQSATGDLVGRIDGVKTGSADVKLVISEVQP